MGTVRDAATVRVSTVVDGTKKRKKCSTRIMRCKTERVLVVDPRVMATAKRVRREGEKIVIVDETTVLLRRAD